MQQINISKLLGFSYSRCSSVTSSILAKATSLSNLASSINLTKKSVTKPVAYYQIRSDYKAPRNTIVLCHGLFGYDIKGPQTFPFLQKHYWPGITETLHKLGAKVLMTKVSEAGTIEQRASQLHQQLEAKLEAGETVNLIGHSMGGLDARYLISRIPNKKYQVSSLTTISTPHHGTTFLDWCREYLRVGLHTEHPYLNSSQDRWVYRMIRWLLDQPAYRDLSSDYMRNYFNPATPDDKKVTYLSYSTKVDSTPFHPLLVLPHQIISQTEGLNDGIVSVNSAKWGKHEGTLTGTHFDVLGGKSFITSSLYKIPYLSSPPAFKPDEFFAKVATKLSRNGF